MIMIIMIIIMIIIIMSIFTHDDNGKALSLLSALRIVEVRPGVEKEGTRCGVCEGDDDDDDDDDNHDGMRPFYLRPFYLLPLLPTSSR